MNILFFNNGTSDKILKTKQTATYRFWELDIDNDYFAFQHLDENRFRKVMSEQMYKFIDVKNYYQANTWPESYKILDELVKNLDPKLIVATSNRIYRQRNEADDLLELFNRSLHPSNASMMMNFMMYRNFYKNTFAIIYLARTYNIPVKYIILDPLEWTFDKLVTKSTNYHFYDYEESNAKFLPYIEYGYFFKGKCEPSIKDLDFVFGTTILTENRKFMQAHIDTIKAGLEEEHLRYEIYLKDKFNETDNFIPYNQYIERIKHAKFTLMIPSYENSEFSSGRFFEALACDCLPIIGYGIMIETMKRAFKKYPALLELVIKYLFLDGCLVHEAIKKIRYEDVIKEFKETNDYKKLCDIDFYKSYMRLFLND